MRPRWHLLDTLKVPIQYRGLRIVYLYDDDHTEDDIQLIIYDNETGDILTHMYVSSASHYSFENH